MMRKGIKADSRVDFTSLFCDGSFETPLSPNQSGQLKDVLERVDKLKHYLRIDEKQREYEEEELRTQAPDFWEDPKRAEEQMKKVKAIKKWIDGYNDVEMENLRDFTAMISSDYHVDEGYGELAYLKYGAPDEEGNFSGDYVWAGLNNFFSIGEMKTGLTIFMVADYPYLALNRPDLDNGEYTFGRVGGMLERQVFGETVPGIEFKAWKPSADDGWEMTCNGEEIPNWLEIELIDGEEEGEFNNIVTAQVFAEPLPEGLSYREAVVRFSFKGAHIDYKFIQGEKIGPTPCPCSGDYGYEGEVTVANLNCMIDYMLEDMYDDCLDLNEDGEFNVADLNVLIDYILFYSN